MKIEIEIKHVNGLNKPKVIIDEGLVSYTLPFDVQLYPGEFDRIVNLFSQRVPVQLTISSPQAKMDLEVKQIIAIEQGDLGPFDPEARQEMLESGERQAEDAIAHEEAEKVEAEQTQRSKAQA